MWANVRRGGNVRLGADTWRHMRWSVQITPLPHHWRVRCLRLLPCLSSSSKVGWGWMGSAWLGLLFGSSSSSAACFLQAFPQQRYTVFAARFKGGILIRYGDGSMPKTPQELRRCR
nr:hypothetical protein Iba_chr04bCG4730 [Ipomoea batatas]